MTDNELKKLNRKELLEILIEQGSEIERLQSELKAAEEKLQEREIKISSAGSLAEASLALSGVFEAAQAAADQYLENVKRCSEQQKSTNDKIVLELEDEQKAKTILDHTESEEQKRNNEADEYWKNLSAKLEVFYQDHIGLQELLSDQSHKKTSENE